MKKQISSKLLKNIVQKKGGKIFFFLSLFFFLFGFLFLIFNKTLAQTILPLTVYPARQFFELEPGEKTAIVVNFVNQSETPISGFIRVVDFIVRDNQGTPELIENPNLIIEKFAASQWFKLENDRVTLPANEKVAFQGQIIVPKNANPGGKYVAFYFQPTSGLNQEDLINYQAATAIIPKLASLFYIKIKGDIKENAFVTRFQTKNFQEFGPIEAETEILNRGDYHITPKGKIILYNSFTGKMVGESFLEEKNIFPETTRLYKNTLGKKWLFGKFKLELEATYGETGKTLTAFTEIFVFPWKIALIITLSLTIVILLFRHFYLSFIQKERFLEEKLRKEEEELEELKKQIKSRD